MSYKNLHILVLIRECSDPRPPAKVITRGAGISDRGLRRIPNPSDLVALEEALRLKDRLGARVTALAIGPKCLDDTLRLAGSLGADRCVRVWDHGFAGGDVSAEARVLARVIEILNPALFFSGSRVIDRGDDPVPAMASAKLAIPCIASVVTFSLKKEGVEALRRVDRGGRQEVAAAFPCMVLFEEGAAPRYPSVDALTDALSAPLELWDLAHLGIPFHEVGATGSRLSSVEFGVPRRDPVRVATPDANLPAFERIISLLSGGIKAREGKVNQLSPEAAAEGIWQIFREEGLLEVL